MVRRWCRGGRGGAVAAAVSSPMLVPMPKLVLRAALKLVLKPALEST